jgi:signal transduction histidine kinase
MRLFKPIIKSPQQELAYRSFMLRYEIYSLQLAFIIGAAHSILFLIIDYWRAADYAFVALHRGLMIFFLTSGAWIVLRIKVAPNFFYALCVAFSTILVLLSFSMDFTSGMPAFFLPNFICLLFFVFNAGLGHPLRLKFIHSIALVIVYHFYTNYFSPHKIFHSSQVWNLLVNVGISIVIGFLIERYKRLNFTQREELLKARKEIEEINSMKSKLISILSHDLNSPLNNLRGLIHLNEKNLISHEEFSTYLEKVGKSIDSISFLLMNLVRWSKSQFQGFQSVLENIEVKKIVNEVLTSVNSTEKNIRIEIDMLEKQFVKADREMFKLAVRNIISNSIKFSQPGSSIKIDFNENETHGTLTISDNGTGMPKAELENLFSLRIKSKTGTRNESGTGIGMMITKEFITLMGGTISADSEVGKGSSFHLKLPKGFP